MNNKGVVLLITLMVVALVMILGGIAAYISTRSTRLSGALKQYNAGLQVANAAYEETKYIVDYIKVNGISPSSSLLDCAVVNASFPAKVLNPTDSGIAAWSGDAQNPDTVTVSPDIVCNNFAGFNVYVKLVNTSPGNTAVGRIRNLNAGGVTTGTNGGSIVTLPRVPYMYNFVVEASRVGIPNDNVTVTLLFGY